MLRTLQETDDVTPDDAATTRPDDDDHATTPDEAVVCAACGHALTARTAQTERGGSHAHVFANPAGLLFDVRCYAPTSGVRALGEAQAFWSWFPGYAWRVGACGGCGAHVGWTFVGTAPFAGLIADTIVP